MSLFAIKTLQVMSTRTVSTRVHNDVCQFSSPNPSPQGPIRRGYRYLVHTRRWRCKPAFHASTTHVTSDMTTQVHSRPAVSQVGKVAKRRSCSMSSPMPLRHVSGPCPCYTPPMLMTASLSSRQLPHVQLIEIQEPRNGTHICFLCEVAPLTSQNLQVAYRAA